ARVHDRQIAPVPQRLERSEPRIESKKTIEIERAGIAAPWPGNRNGRPRAVVVVLTVRDDHAQPVDGPALKDCDELLRANRGSGGKRGSGEKRGRETEAHERERSVFQEYASRDHVPLPRSGRSRTPRLINAFGTRATPVRARAIAAESWPS